MDRTGWNWLVLLLIAVSVLGGCVLIFIRVLSKWAGCGGLV